MLLRRNIRKRILSDMQLRASNVKSHINGSITIAVRRGTHGIQSLIDLRSDIETVFNRHGFDNMYLCREGFARSDVLYVTYTSRAMAEEAAARYGIHRMFPVIDRIEAGAGRGEPVEIPREIVDTAMQDEDFDFSAVPVLGGTELELSEV